MTATPRPACSGAMSRNHTGEDPLEVGLGGIVNGHRLVLIRRVLCAPCRDAAARLGMIERRHRDEDDDNWMAEWSGDAIRALVRERNRLLAVRRAAYWYRAMHRLGGPDGGDLDEATAQDLDSALGDYDPLDEANGDPAVVASVAAAMDAYVGTTTNVEFFIGELERRGVSLVRVFRDDAQTVGSWDRETTAWDGSVVVADGTKGMERGR